MTDTPPALPEPLSQLDRIEQKVDLISELLLRIWDEEEEPDGPTIDLDGQVAGGARDQSQGLG
jgi:hypothetical protein